MGIVYILNQNFDFLGVIDEYKSIIWRPSYSDIGDFELYMSATSKALTLLEKNNYIVRASDISKDDANKVIYKNVMVIKNLKITTDAEDGDYITVTGRELKYLLHQRIIWTQTNLSGLVEDCIRQLVTENAISPTDSNRIIPTLQLAASAGLTDEMDKQVTGEHLDEAIIDICNSYNYGWDVYVYDFGLTFAVYAGLDRSYNQSERPYVVFSESFDNLYNTEYEMETEQFANTTLIGGEGEGTERIYTTVGAENSGLERYEIFTDAKDISQNKNSTNAIALDTYYTLLQERGRENLASKAVTEGFTGEVLSDITYVYNTDFYLGDIVTVINKHGMTKHVRIISAIESEDDDGTKLVPQFNM